MEIVGIGTDIVECVRIARMVEEHGELFLQRVYTPREIRYCQERKHAYEHLPAAGPPRRRSSSASAPAGARGCAGPTWRFATTRMVPRRSYICGAAKERAVFLKISDILLTISHCRAYATATAIAVGKSPGQ